MIELCFSAIQLKSPVPEEMANVPEEGNVHSLNVRKQHENHDVIQGMV